MAEAVKARSGGSDDSKIVSFMIEYMRKKIENLDTKINEEINVRVGVEANVAKLNDYIEQMQYKIKEAEDNLAWEFPSVSLLPSSDIRYRRENMIIKDATHNESIDSEMSIERENPEHYIEQKNIKNKEENSVQNIELKDFNDFKNVKPKDVIDPNDYSVQNIKHKDINELKDNYVHDNEKRCNDKLKHIFACDIEKKYDNESDEYSEKNLEQRDINELVEKRGQDIKQGNNNKAVVFKNENIPIRPDGNISGWTKCEKIVEPLCGNVQSNSKDKGRVASANKNQNGEEKTILKVNNEENGKFEIDSKLIDMCLSSTPGSFIEIESDDE